MKHRLIAIDEGKQQLALIDTSDPHYGWTRALADFPIARDLQRIAADRVLVGFERGFVEIAIHSGEVLRVCQRWHGVTAVTRRDDGSTLVTGENLDGRGGVNVLTLDRDLNVVNNAQRPGNYVRLMRPSGDGGYLLCLNDHILDTDAALATRRTLRAPGFEHAWKAERQADGTTLVAAGYGAFMARFDADGKLAGTFGGRDSVPAAVAPFFYASFQVLADGRILVANWQGHGAENGHKGRQLLEFDAAGRLLDSWSDTARISSLQGILVL